MSCVVASISSLKPSRDIESLEEFDTKLLQLTTDTVDCNRGRSSSTATQKSLSFASDLESVVYFDQRAPTRTLLASDQDKLDDTSHVYNEKSSSKNELKGSSSHRIELLNFDSVLHEYQQDMLKRVQDHCVGMQKVWFECRDCPSELILRGSVLVRNLAFEKSITVRFTTDYWHTYQDITARWTHCLGNGIDAFCFEIDLTHDPGLSNLDITSKPILTLWMAVRYEVHVATLSESGSSQMEHQVYWDNNYGSNYGVEVYRQLDPSISTANITSEQPKDSSIRHSPSSDDIHIRKFKPDEKSFWQKRYDLSTALEQEDHKTSCQMSTAFFYGDMFVDTPPATAPYPHSENYHHPYSIPLVSCHDPSMCVEAS